MLDDVLDVLAVEGLVFEQRGGDLFHRVAVRADDFLRLFVGAVDEVQDLGIDGFRRLFAWKELSA